jgi:hypothetical protein
MIILKLLTMGFRWVCHFLQMVRIEATILRKGLPIGFDKTRCCARGKHLTNGRHAVSSFSAAAGRK